MSCAIISKCRMYIGFLFVRVWVVEFVIQIYLLTFTYLLITYLLTYLLTPWSSVILGNLTGFQLVKKFPAFYGARRSQVPATGLYPDPAQSSPYPHIPLTEEPP
jgi:hypothetical protein